MIKHIGCTGLMTLVVLALASGSTFLASAASTRLPEFSIQTGGTATSGEVIFSFAETKLACRNSATTLAAGAKLGTFAIAFRECKGGGRACTGLGQSEGTIEANGTWHLVSLLSDRTHYGLWFLLAASDDTEAIHDECLGLRLLWGNFLALIVTISSKTYKLNIETEGERATLKQTMTEFGNNSGETVKISGLKEKLGTGAEAVMNLTLDEDLLAMEKATSIKES
jgi:hypothetical protein